jgi:aminoglycoside phosphotransferase (APT) family kinase protein
MTRSRLEQATRLAVTANAGPVWRRFSGRVLGVVIPLVPDILAAARAQGVPVDAGWRMLRAEVTETRVAVVVLGHSPAKPRAVLKLACTSEAGHALQGEATVLCALQADPRLAGWREVAPTVLASGETAGRRYLLESALTGQRLSDRPRAAVTRRRALGAAAAAVSVLHRQTAAAAVADSVSLGLWVREPLGVLERTIASRSTQRARALDRLEGELVTGLAGRIVRVSWIHGDYWLGNILFAPDGSTVTGIVDWDQAAPAQPPQLDLLHLFLYARALEARRDLGAVLGEIVTEGRWPEGLLRQDAGLAGDARHVRAFALLYWLRHVAGNLVQSAHYAQNRVWLRRNVDVVLRCL